jgi:anti-sigma factor RsiW
MPSENLHVSDEELLLAADGELSNRRAAEVRSHLAACWNCRARMAALEGTIVDFTRSHRQTLDPQLPAVDGPRARLRAELAALTAESSANSWQRIFWSTSAVRAAAYVSLGLFAVVLSAKLLVQHSERYRANPAVISFERGAVPDHSLTPGATRRVTIGDVCSMAHEDVVREVPTSLRQQVFQEYGIVNARADDYEIDYLIAPGLGGVEDIHNLWPEPYSSPLWNARVKDALEEHLHQLVCAGKVDLSTAQNDIATDWIAAYKKYFHTDRPLSLSSGIDSVTFLRSPKA